MFFSRWRRGGWLVPVEDDTIQQMIHVHFGQPNN